MLPVVIRVLHPRSKWGGAGRRRKREKKKQEKKKGWGLPCPVEGLQWRHLFFMLSWLDSVSLRVLKWDGQDLGGEKFFSTILHFRGPTPTRLLRSRKCWNSFSHHLLIYKILHRKRFGMVQRTSKYGSGQQLIVVDEFELILNYLKNFFVIIL